jgi:outer membrane protein X
MKKIIIVSVFLGLLFSASGAFAQESVKNRLGFFLAAASGDIDQIGIGGIGEFKVANRVTISPQILFYLPESRGNYDWAFMELNANANYYFYNQDIFEFYGFGGLNFTRWQARYDGPGNNNDFDDESDVEIGLNLGGGINFEVGRNFVPFSEIRVTVGDFDQIVISAGLKFNLRSN